MLVRTLSSSLPLISLPAIAAESSSVTGITGVGPAMFLFLTALALFLSLLLRHSAGRIAQRSLARLGQYRIERLLRRKGRAVLKDCIVPGAYGGLARIDYALLTAGGIFCIRTVDGDGVVFGDRDDAQWTHVDGIGRRRFLNPLIQNEGRRRALGNIVPEAPIANLVVFTGKVEFPSPPPQNVIRRRDLGRYLAKHAFGPSRVEDWDALWMNLEAAVLGDEASRRDFEAQLSFG